MNKLNFLFLLCSIVIFSFFASCTGVNKNNDLIPESAEIGKKDLNKAVHFYNQGLTSDIKGDFDQALIYYEKAIEAYPDHAQAYNNMAWLMATCPEEKYRNGAKAVEFAQKAVHLSRKADFLDTLAAAYAEAGQFEDAIETQKQAIDSLGEEEKPNKLTEYDARLTCYESTSPWRKTNSIDAFKESVLKTKVQVPDQESEKNAAVEIQDDISARKEAPILKPIKETPGKENMTVTDQKTDKRSLPAVYTVRYPFTIHVSSFKDKKKSSHETTELRERGLPAFTCPVHIPGKGDWHRVFIGHYETREAVQSAVLKMAGGKYANALPVKMPYAVQVGIFDTDHDLEKLEADLRSKDYFAYSLPDGTAAQKIRLLVGAYKTKEDAEGLSKKLNEEGFKAEVVRR